jgi:hypothetical protein
MQCGRYRPREAEQFICGLQRPCYIIWNSLTLKFIRISRLQLSTLLRSSPSIQQASLLWMSILLLISGHAQAQPDPITFGQLEAQYLTAAPFVADTAA